MKIALVSPYDFAYPGGVAIHILSLEHHLTKMGHKVKVIAPTSGRVSAFDDRFIPIGKPRPIPASGSICRVTLSPWLSSTIKKVLDKEQFDIIHLHEPLMPMLCTTILRMSPTATVGTFHAYCGPPRFKIGKPLDGYNFGRPITTLLLRKWFRRLDGKIAVSKPAKEFVSRLFPGYYTTIPNGVDVEHFSPQVSPIDTFGDGKINILFTGRLEKRKGLKYLLQAYKIVKKEVPNSRLIITGPGTRLRKKYEKQVISDGLKDVVFTGYVSHEELPRYYKTADIFCTPATGWESFGIVLLEAMATGKPLIASNISGYANLINHGVEGLLVPPRDERGLAQALYSLMTDESLRQQMGARGRLKAEEHSWERIAHRIFNYYTSVLSEPPWNKRFTEFGPKPLGIK
ncbi:glycosyltransferase family 4 protein [Chloroflexota bacterium]